MTYVMKLFVCFCMTTIMTDRVGRNVYRCETLHWRPVEVTIWGP